nr:DNA-binding domain-containing protein [uncultured Rhodoferax sp.]
MSTLALQQQALVAALFDRPAHGAMKSIAARAIDMGGRGLKAYQSNGHALADRALQAAYPVLAQLVGDESMGNLARAYWHAHPPVCGDVAQWGEGLADFVAHSSQLQDAPYLPDVARVEWALHGMAHLEDASPDLGTLALLSTEDPGKLHLRLAPGTAALSSAWPVATIHAAHGENGPSFEEVGRLLQARAAEDAVVWRQGFRPCVRLAVAGEAAFLNALLAGQRLGEALDAAPHLDVSQWLTTAVQSGLLLAVRSGV